MIRAVIFDLDDTLYREWDFVRGGFKVVARHVARLCRARPADVYRKLLQQYFLFGRDNTFGRLLKEMRLEGACDVARLVKIYRNHSPKLRLFDDAKKTLFRLKEIKCRLGMITDGDDSVQKNKVAALGIQRYFSSIIYTHEFGVNCYKPNPFSYNLLAKNLGCSFSDMVYVGDNPEKDFITAKKLGMVTVRLMRGPFAQVPADEEHEAHIRMDSFCGFMDWLAGTG